MISALAAFRDWATRPTVRRWLLVVAAISFAVLTGVAISNLPPDLGPIGWPSVVVACTVVIPIAWLLGLEFREIAGIAGHVIGKREAFKVSMLASASNLLPIPGAVAVKTGSLVAAGRTVRTSVGANIVVAVLWVAVALIFGAPFAFDSSLILGLVSAAAGMGLLLIGFVGVRRAVEDVAVAKTMRVVAIEIGLTLAAVLRVWFVMAAIGVEPSITASVWLVVVSVLATVVGLFPAGLGLREAMSAAVAPVIGLDPSVAVLISAVDRIVRLGVLAILGAFVSGLERRWSSV